MLLPQLTMEELLREPKLRLGILFQSLLQHLRMGEGNDPIALRVDEEDGDRELLRALDRSDVAGLRPQNRDRSEIGEGREWTMEQ